MVRGLAACMSDYKDPEKQLRIGEGEQIDKLLPVHIMDYPGGQCVQDIGREWRERRGLVKWDKSSDGDITWRAE
jgi:hypothetical protein